MVKTAKKGAGALTEQITILSSTPVAIAVTSITRVGQVVTVTTATAHGFTTGDYAVHAGAGQPEYNVEAPVTVTGPTTYTFVVSGAPATPATGTITATWTSDSQGGGGSGWYTLDSGVWANIEAMSAGEQLAAGGISAIGSYNCMIRYRTDVKETMRVVWRQKGEPAGRTYEIHAVQPNKDEPRTFIDLEIGIVEG